MNKQLILVVEDDAAVQNLITTTLETQKYRYLTAGNGETAYSPASGQGSHLIRPDVA